LSPFKYEILRITTGQSALQTSLVRPERHIGRVFRRLRSTGIYLCGDEVTGATKLCDAVIPGGHGLLFARIDPVRDNHESLRRRSDEIEWIAGYQGEYLAISWIQYFDIVRVDDCRCNDFI
jgi:hypothetical protein